MSGGMLAALIVSGVILLQVAVWVPIVIVRKKNAKARAASMNDELATLSQRGERMVLSPASARIRRGHVSGRGMVALTSERLIIRGRTREELRIADIIDVRHSSSFNSEYFGGSRFVIVAMRDREVGFGVLEADAQQWVDAIKKCIAERSASAVA